LDDKLARWKYEDSRLDFIEVGNLLYGDGDYEDCDANYEDCDDVDVKTMLEQELLMRNLDHCAELIISFLDFQVRQTSNKHTQCGIMPDLNIFEMNNTHHHLCHLQKWLSK
jgi:hypothetical protein